MAPSGAGASSAIEEAELDEVNGRSARVAFDYVATSEFELTVNGEFHVPGRVLDNIKGRGFISLTLVPLCETPPFISSYFRG